jgi:hypothetical protein
LYTTPVYLTGALVSLEIRSAREVTPRGTCRDLLLGAGLAVQRLGVVGRAVLFGMGSRSKMLRAMSLARGHRLGALLGMLALATNRGVLPVEELAVLAGGCAAFGPGHFELFRATRVTTAKAVPTLNVERLPEVLGTMLSLDGLLAVLHSALLLRGEGQTPSGLGAFPHKNLRGFVLRP